MALTIQRMIVATNGDATFKWSDGSTSCLTNEKVELKIVTDRSIQKENEFYSFYDAWVEKIKDNSYYKSKPSEINFIDYVHGEIQGNEKISAAVVEFATEKMKTALHKQSKMGLVFKNK